MQLSLIDPKHPITEVYLANALHKFGLSLISVFVPIYLLTLGYSIQNAFVFLVVLYLTSFVLAPISLWISGKIGIKKTTLLRIPFFLIEYYLLFNLAGATYSYLLPAIFTGVASSLYWVPMHSLFVKYSTEHTRGASLGKFSGIPTALAVIGPILGGIIAAAFGFQSLLVVAVVLISLSTLPLFLTKDLYPGKNFSPKDITAINEKPFIIQCLADGSSSVAGSTLFPILIYTISTSTQSVGAISSLAGFISAIIIFLVAKKSQVTKSMRVAAFWGSVFAITLFVRAFITTIPQAVIVIIAGAILYPLYNTNVQLAFYTVAANLKEKGDELIVIREFAISGMRALTLLILVFIPWKLGFILCAAVLWVVAIYLWRNPQAQQTA